MKRSNYLALLCLLPLVFAGCDSDDVLSLVDPNDEAAVAVADATSTFMVPAVARLNLIEVLPSPTGKAAQGFTCSDVGECASGTWNDCGISGGFEYVFDACMLDGELVTGTISTSGTFSGGTYLSGNTEYDVTVDALTYAGYVVFTRNGDCVVETIGADKSIPQGFTLSNSADVAAISGSLTYCPSSSYPTGSISVSVTGTSTYVADVTFDGTQAAVVEFDGGGGTAYSCATGLATGAVTCQALGV